MNKGKYLTEYTELMKQWDYAKNKLNLAGIAAGAHKYAWWLCEKGHSWEALIKNRVLANSGCPVCTSKKVLPGFNDLRTTEPRIADEWDDDKNGDLTPEMVTRSSGKVVWWKCKAKGHSWDMTVVNRSNNGYGCPICSNKRVLTGYNDLLTLNPQLADEWDFDKNTLLPSQVTVSSGKHVFWKCSKGHSWKAKISLRNLGGTDCPVCDGKIVLAGFNDLQTRNPKLAEEWDYEKNELLPSQVTLSTTRKAWWICGRGHSWKAAISNRNNGTGCPVCSNRKVLVGYNDLKTINPALADEWDCNLNDRTQEQVTFKSNRVVWWKCGKGHSWEATVCDRHNGTGCPVCSGHKVLAGFNDLETLNPDLAAEWDYEKNTMLPSQVAVFSDTAVWWKCKNKGHSWKTSVASRSSGRNCPRCVGRISYTPKCVY